MSKLTIRPYFSGLGLWPTAFPDDVFERLNAAVSNNFDYLFNQINDLEGFNSSSRSLSLKGFPKGDIFVEDKKLVVELALAGYSKEQLKVKVSPENSEIIIEAQKKDEGKNGRSVARRSFYKTIEVMPEWDLKQTDVSYVDGLLKITVPLADVEKEKEPKYTDLEIK